MTSFSKFVSSCKKLQVVVTHVFIIDFMIFALPILGLMTHYPESCKHCYLLLLKVKYAYVDFIVVAVTSITFFKK